MEKRSSQSDSPISPSSKALRAVRAPIATSAKSIHSGVKRSQTLVRRATKKPISTKSALPTRGRVMDIAKSPSINRFTSFNRPQSQTSKTSDSKRPLQHPIMNKLNLSKKPASTQTLSNKETKDKLIEEAIAKIPTSSKKSPKSSKNKKIYKILFAAISVAILISAVWALYVFVPAVSIRIAASQAGINATYPSYTPEGYRFEGPIVYRDNKVWLKYSGQSSGSYYQITEEKSSWDSSAVKENIASAWANHTPSSFEEQGQNVYYSVTTNETKAAWVNGGILYQLSDNSGGLKYDNIRRIVKSM